MTLLHPDVFDGKAVSLDLLPPRQRKKHRPENLSPSQTWKFFSPTCTVICTFDGKSANLSFGKPIPTTGTSSVFLNTYPHKPPHLRMTAQTSRHEALQVDMFLQRIRYVSPMEGAVYTLSEWYSAHPEGIYNHRIRYYPEYPTHNIVSKLRLLLPLLPALSWYSP